MNQTLPFIIALCAIACMFLSCDSSNNNNKNIPEEETPVEGEQHDDSLHLANINSELMQSMIRMMDQMVKMKTTKDSDYDIISMLIIHHQGAIDAANIELAKGSDIQVKNMAKDIMARQSSEIKALKKIQDLHKPVEGEKHNELNESVIPMMSKIKGIQMTGNIDKDFVMLMIPHLQCAIDLATQEVLNGHHVKLKLMAQDMITEHKKSLAVFKAWLSAH